MNKQLLDKFVACSRTGRKLCNCYRDDSPDDMQMGMWVSAYLGVPISNDMGFHQAAASSYHPEVLKHQFLISFHKFDDKAEAVRTYEDHLTSAPDGHEL